MKKQIIKSVCGKCNKEQPPDRYRSTPEWTYYDNKKPCKCGALDWTLKIIKPE